MAEAVGTILVFALAGIIFGDDIGKKIAVKMLLGSLVFALLISPAFAVGLVVAPFAMGIMLIGGLIAFFRKL